MKYIAGLIIFTSIAGLAWPYLYVWRLDTAVASGNLVALERLVDVDALRTQVKDDFKRDVDRTVGSDGGKVFRWLKQGIALVSDSAIEANIDLEWARSALGTRPGDPPTPRPSLIGDVSYAFYESYDTFFMRLGELGEQPVHVRMALQEGTWRVVEIFRPRG
jgi:hypothetical protein